MTDTTIVAVKERIRVTKQQIAKLRDNLQADEMWIEQLTGERPQGPAITYWGFVHDGEGRVNATIGVVDSEPLRFSFPVWCATSIITRIGVAVSDAEGWLEERRENATRECAACGADLDGGDAVIVDHG